MKLGWVVFTIPPYSTDLNKIKHSLKYLSQRYHKGTLTRKQLLRL